MSTQVLNRQDLQSRVLQTDLIDSPHHRLHREACPRSCARCYTELGYIINRGAICGTCSKRICKSCRVYCRPNNISDWECAHCHQLNESHSKEKILIAEYSRLPKGNNTYTDASFRRRSFNVTHKHTVSVPEIRRSVSLPRDKGIEYYPYLHRIQNTLRFQRLGSLNRKDKRVSDNKIETDGTNILKSAINAAKTLKNKTNIKQSLRRRYNSLSPKRSDNGNKKDYKRSDKRGRRQRSVSQIASCTELIDVLINHGKTNGGDDTSKSNKMYEKRKNKSVGSEDQVDSDVDAIPEMNKYREDVKPVVLSEDTPDATQVLSKNATSGVCFATDKVINPTDNEECFSFHEDALQKKIVIKKKFILTNDGDSSGAHCLQPSTGASTRSADPVRSESSRRDDLLDVDAGRILVPDGDDYKLVFISSDSSSKEEENDNDSSSTSSIATGRSFSLDDCDWDYFESGAATRPVLKDWSWSNKNSPYSSPKVYRRSTVLESPFGSPLVYRKYRESDTGTDEDTTNATFHLESSSPGSSDGLSFIKRRRYVKTSSESSSLLDENLGGSYIDNSPSVYVNHRRLKQTSASDTLGSEADRSTEEVTLVEPHLPQHTAHMAHMPQCVQQVCGERKRCGDRCRFSGGDHCGTQTISGAGLKELTVESQTPVRPCESCGSSPQYVPFPVPVPIPVPVPALWNPNDAVIMYNSDNLDPSLKLRLRAIQQRQNALFPSPWLSWPFVVSPAHAALIAPLITQASTGVWPTGATGNHRSTAESPRQSTIASKGTESESSMMPNSEPKPEKTREKQNELDKDTETKESSKSEVSDNSGEVINSVENEESVPKPSASDAKQSAVQDEVNEVQSVTVDVNKKSIEPDNSADNDEDDNDDNDNDDDDNDDNDNDNDDGDNKTTVDLVTYKQLSNSDDNLGKEESTSQECGFGYLLSENVFESDDSSISDSENSDRDSGNSATEKPRVQRSYNVTGESPTSDEALASSDICSTDGEDGASQSSAREDMSSSTTGGTDTDDTGTVADKRPKKFSKVFVVNNNDSSSDDDSCGNSDSDSDTSDNDTDTEMDCGIVLNYMKEINDEPPPSDNDDDDGGVMLISHKMDIDKSNNITLNYVRTITEENIEKELNDIVYNRDDKIKQKNKIFDDDINECITKIIFHSEPTSSDLCADGIDREHSCTIEDSYSRKYSKEQIEIGGTTPQTNTTLSERCTVSTVSETTQVTADCDVRQVESKTIPGNEVALDSNTNNECNVLNTSDNTNTELIRECEPPGGDNVVLMQLESHVPDSVDFETLNAEEKAKVNVVDADSSAVNNAINQIIDPMQQEGRRVSTAGTVEGVEVVGSSETIDSLACVAANIHTGVADPSSDTASESNKHNENILVNQNATSASTPELYDSIVNVQQQYEHGTSFAGTQSVDPVTSPPRVPQPGVTRLSPHTALAHIPSPRSNQHKTQSVDSESVLKQGRYVYSPNPANTGARYTSLVMITQEPPAAFPQVSVVTSDTTTLVPNSPDAEVIVQHTNWQSDSEDRDELVVEPNSLAGYFTLALEQNIPNTRAPRRPHVVSKNIVNSVDSDAVTVVVPGNNANSVPVSENVTVVTSSDTLSAVVCLEEGLADDDSWVEDVSHDEDEFATTTATESDSGDELTLSSSLDREEELRGYHRQAIDCTLHTIFEESCEESEVEQMMPHVRKTRPLSSSELEKYFFFGLGDGVPGAMCTNREDAMSETSSIYSEGMDSLGQEEVNNDATESSDLASSRLEKYFLTGFMGFSERRDSDGSGSVGSDSEGRPSPEQRRKKLVRARGTGRSHSSSLDNLLAHAELSANEQGEVQMGSEDSSSSTETDTCEETLTGFEKSDGQFDTVKRKKQNKKQKGVPAVAPNSPVDDKKFLDITQELKESDSLSDDENDGHKTPQPEFLLPMSSDLANSKKQHSRDSGFIGSCDDLLKDQRNQNDDTAKLPDLKIELEEIAEENKMDEKSDSNSLSALNPPSTSLARKDSFNNWSSDEETNLMMSKMRQFFKTMVATGANSQNLQSSSKHSTPSNSQVSSPKPTPSPRVRSRNKPPQLLYFESELTRLMKTVPGIRDDQVREIVEYLSSEDTWSDSYDSSDYTSSDLEGAASAAGRKSALQQQISDSCQQIINKFDPAVEDAEGDQGDGGVIDEAHGLNRETAFVYQKLVASFSKMAAGESVNTDTTTDQVAPNSSPPLIAKVMHHIGSRLVALMHEVSSGESHASTSPKVRYHRRLQQKISSTSTTTTEDDDSTSDSNLPDRLGALESMSAYSNLPRSKSHDLLLAEARPHHQSSSGVSDIAEEREASDYERFSWRGSFESALMAADSRTKLSLLGGEASASASALALAAKRRSAGDLLFNHKSLSREQLDRVRSCGSIGGGNSEDRLWVTPAPRPNRRRSSVPDAACGSGGSADGEDDEEEDDEQKNRSTTLPRSLQNSSATTNSLPRLPTTSTVPVNSHKSHTMHQFLQNHVKSARYRPPGFNRGSNPPPTTPKRTASAPGLQPTHPRRDGRRRLHASSPLSTDDSSISGSSSPLASQRYMDKSLSTNALSSPTSSGFMWSSKEESKDKLFDLNEKRPMTSLGVRSDSMASVYSGAGDCHYGSVMVKGDVEFGLQYNYKPGSLLINIKQCRDLAAIDMKRNRSDPYVKVYLLPDKSKSGKRKTKVKKHTLNPCFDETLSFNLTLEELKSRTLWLTVWHSDMFGRNDFLGEVMMSLEDKIFDDPTPKWYQLQERTEPFEDITTYKGDIIIGLKFIPPDMTSTRKGKRSRGALHVLIKEAKNLTAVKANGTSDPFCKSYLLPDKGRSSKQKTPVLRRCLNPKWNYTFIYDDVTLQDLSERALELTVWDHDRLGSNEFLGMVRFSLGTGKYRSKSEEWMEATDKEISLWQNMLGRPNFWVEGCLSLRPSLGNKTG